MIDIVYTPSFLKGYGKLPRALQNEVKEKIQIFERDQNHPFLKTHKLKGGMKGCYSFSVNYSTRIIFTYDTKSTAALLFVGGHDIYR